MSFRPLIRGGGQKEPIDPLLANITRFARGETLENRVESKAETL